MAQSSTAQVALPKKRTASTAGIGEGKARAVKRRASKACQCCRARKVRCNVVEHGAPCTNCRLDEVECIVTEGKRRKKFNPPINNKSKQPSSSTHAADVDEATKYTDSVRVADLNPLDGMSQALFSPSLDGLSYESDDQQSHVPHLIYQTQSQIFNQNPRDPYQYLNNVQNPSQIPSHLDTKNVLLYPTNMCPRRPASSLPDYIKPLPARITPEDIQYLEKKGALHLPRPALRNQLLKSYVEYVHPYMPLLDLNEFLGVIESNGPNPLSLLLFQAVMFAGTAFIDIKYLRAAGFSTRKAARKLYFQKARLLYDFDYEVDRIALVQALLLMTYWYETPDDQKDTWHWMGVAISLAHTIGLHRNPETTIMDQNRRRLWKRMWWSCFMRDRLIALGMRRPTRIKSEDFDVPMLELSDFEFKPVPDYITCLPSDCTIARNVSQMRQLACMVIEKSKLCLCISHVLEAQYSILSSQPHGISTVTTMMLVPKKSGSEHGEIQACDGELERWFTELPDSARYDYDAPRDLGPGEDILFLHRALLNMIYHTTISALHRPQVLLSGTPTASNFDDEQRDVSRNKVRSSADEITRMARDLQKLDLVRYLPTSGVTVLLPAIIIHLLDIKSTSEEVRRSCLYKFIECMQAMQRLREIYTSADFGTQFIEAAIRKAGIPLNTFVSQRAPQRSHSYYPFHPSFNFSVNTRASPMNTTTLTPPPDASPFVAFSTPGMNTESPESQFATTPPQSVRHDSLFSSNSPTSPTTKNTSVSALASMAHIDTLPDIFCSVSATDSTPAVAPSTTFSTNLGSTGTSTGGIIATDTDTVPFSTDFDLLLNLDTAPEMTVDDFSSLFQESKDGIGVATNLQGESSGFALDLDDEWVQSIASISGTETNNTTTTDSGNNTEMVDVEDVITNQKETKINV